MHDHGQKHGKMKELDKSVFLSIAEKSGEIEKKVAEEKRELFG